MSTCRSTHDTLGDLANLCVKVAFTALVSHYIGSHTNTETLSAIPLLPWPTIACVCISVAALFGAFHKVAVSIASGLLWAFVTLASIALVLTSAVAFAVVQFGTPQHSERIVQTLISIGTAIASRIGV